MRQFLFLMILFLMCLPAMAENVAIDITLAGAADGYQCFTRDYENDYDFAGTPAWEGNNTTANLDLPDDRQTGAQCRAWVWGPFDFAGVRTRVYGPFSDEQVFVPTTTPPEKPTIIIRILVAVLDFLSGPFAGFSNIVV